MARFEVLGKFVTIRSLIDKPWARLFAGSVVAVGLALHGISVARKRIQPAGPTPEAEMVKGRATV